MKIHHIALMLTFFVLASCGNSKKEEKQKEESFKINKNVEAEKQKDDGVTEIILTGNDQMRFNLKEIKVNAGDKVKLTLKHVGKLGVQAMGHNFVLLKPSVKINDFAQKAVDARENDYIPENTDDLIVHTELIGGGEQTTITFDAPEKGVYDFICSFPGHVALMQGKFIVG